LISVDDYRFFTHKSQKKCPLVLDFTILNGFFQQFIHILFIFFGNNVTIHGGYNERINAHASKTGDVCCVLAHIRTSSVLDM
jgi:hypothetical protein